jgi:microtubule-associated protein, RP/EB family
VANYKLLQAAFNKQRVQRHVDVDKLIRAKYQDNLEFCQWLKAFYDQSGQVRENYDPLGVRAKGKGGKKFNDKMENVKAPTIRKPTTPRVIPASRSPQKARAEAAPGSAKPVVNTRRPVTSTAAAPKPKPAAVRPKAPLKERTKATNAGSNAAAADALLTKKNTELSSKVTELEGAVIEIEKERDFYFSKLRNIELMLQVQQDKGWESADLKIVVDNIFKVLYATAEEEVAVGENGEVTYTIKSPYMKSGTRRTVKLTYSYIVTIQIIGTRSEDFQDAVENTASMENEITAVDQSTVSATSVTEALNAPDVSLLGEESNAADVSTFSLENNPAEEVEQDAY